MLRALRPDRMTYAIAVFIEEKLGPRYVEARTVEFAKSFEETSPSTPIFFILSPGVNPLKVIMRHSASSRRCFLKQSLSELFK